MAPSHQRWKSAERDCGKETERQRDETREPALRGPGEGWPGGQPAGSREERGQLLWPEEGTLGRRRDVAMWRLDRPGWGRAENGPRAGRAACSLAGQPCTGFLGCRWRDVPGPASPGQCEGATPPGHLTRQPGSGVWRLCSSAAGLPSDRCTSPSCAATHARAASQQGLMWGKRPPRPPGSRKPALTSAYPLQVVRPRLLP